MSPVATPARSIEARREQGQRWVSILLRGRIVSVIGFLITLVVVFTLTGKNFATIESFRSITVNASIFAIVACGEGVVILTRNYDLSVGSTMGLAAYVSYDIGKFYTGPEQVLVVFGIAVGIGLACGVLNGLLVAYGKIPSFIATLGTLSIFRGVLFVYGSGRLVTPDQIPDWAHAMVTTPFLGLVASLVIIAAIVVTVAAIAVRYLPIGRQFYAVGSNPAAGEFYGLNSNQVILRAYIISGLFAGFAGVLFGAQVSYIIQYAGQNYELLAIGACVIGGISITGGSGNLLGAALGVLVLATIDNGLVQLSLPQFARQLIQGSAIILAVLSDGIIQDRARRVLKATRRRGVTP
jgi:rhamnose transport system permease protein